MREKWPLESIISASWPDEIVVASSMPVPPLGFSAISSREKMFRDKSFIKSAILFVLAMVGGSTALSG